MKYLVKLLTVYDVNDYKETISKIKPVKCYFNNECIGECSSPFFMNNNICIYYYGSKLDKNSYYNFRYSGSEYERLIISQTIKYNSCKISECKTKLSVE